MVTTFANNEAEQACVMLRVCLLPLPPTLMSVLYVISSGTTPSSRIHRSASSARRTSRARMHALSSVLMVVVSGSTPSWRSWLHLQHDKQRAGRGAG